MQIAGVASAFPEHYYPQEELVAELQKYWGDRIENPDVLRRLHRHSRRRRPLSLHPQKRIPHNEELGRS